ncbi:MAG: SET domain-containing protein [Candidatus Pacebacteria bacterium]|nr:SET domain-containing protein [Candidatus Paceibacterota bacterium]
MIHIKYKIKSSLVHGVGLFSDQEVKKGELVYTPSPLLDTDITEQQFEGLSSSEQKEVMYYGYFNLKTQKYHVAFDAIRILNHADVGIANVSQDENMVMRSLRNIKVGEELFQDYREIFPNGNEHFKRIYSL